MIKREDILADLHMHTTSSLHAYSSLSEMIEASRKANFKYIAITDHLFQYDDYLLRNNETARIEYLSGRMRFEKDIRIIGGVELNINQEVIDINKFKKAKCWMPLGLHSWFADYNNTTVNDVYEFYEKAADLNNCTGFAHIERDLQKLKDGCNELDKEKKNFFEKMVDLSINTGIPLELNECSFLMPEHNSEERINYWIGIAKEKGAKLYIGSDAHFYSELGHFENVIRILNKFNYPKDLILNLNEDDLKKLVKD